MVPDNKSEHVPVIALDRCLEEGHAMGLTPIQKTVMPRDRVQLTVVGQPGRTMADVELKDAKKVSV